MRISPDEFYLTFVLEERKNRRGILDGVGRGVSAAESVVFVCFAKRLALEDGREEGNRDYSVVLFGVIRRRKRVSQGLPA